MPQGVDPNDNTGGGGGGASGSTHIWFETLNDAAAWVGTGIKQAAWIMETTAEYEFFPGDVSVVDGFRIVNNAGGRWILNGNQITLQPIDGVSDDWPRLNLAMQAMAYHGSIVMGTGTWICKSSLLIPNGTTIYASPDVQIIQTLPVASGSPLDAAFAATSTLVGPVGALAATPAKNAYQILSTIDIVVSTTNPHYVNIQDNTGSPSYYRCANYKVIKSTPSGPNFILELDRPIQFAFHINDIIQEVKPVQDILLFFNGATISGFGSRYIEIIGAFQNCGVENVNLSSKNGTVTERLMSMDIGSYNAFIRNVIGDGFGLDSVGNPANVPIGLSLEGCELTRAENCSITRCNTNFIFQDSVGCIIRDCLGSLAVNLGLSFSKGVGNTLGSMNCVVENGEYCTNVVGIEFDVGTSGCKIIGRTKISGNTSKNLNVNTCTDCAVLGADLTNSTGTGLFVGNAVRFSASDIDISDCLTCLDLSARITIDNLKCTSTRAANAISIQNTGELIVSHLIGKVTSVVNFINMIAGSLCTITDSVIELGANNTSGVVLNGAGAILNIKDSRIAPSGGATGTVGLYNQIGLAKVNNLDADTCAAPIYSGSATGIFELYEKSGVSIVPMADANQTLTYTQLKSQVIETTGANTGIRDVIFTPIVKGYIWTINCKNTGFGVRVIGATGTGINIAAGAVGRVYYDGTNMVAA